MENSTIKSRRNIRTPNKTIVLIGLMGAGKSSIGRRLARSLDIPFYDSDMEIAEAAGCSISDIFEIHGEDIFRDLEGRILNRLLSYVPGVVATGGGAFMNPGIRETIHEKSISIWLRAELEILLERVSRRNTRPLLEKGDKRAILTKLMDERYPVYATADIVVDSDDGSHDKVVEAILERIAEYQVPHD